MPLTIALKVHPSQNPLTLVNQNRYASWLKIQLCSVCTHYVHTSDAHTCRCPISYSFLVKMQLTIWTTTSKVVDLSKSDSNLYTLGQAINDWQFCLDFEECLTLYNNRAPFTPSNNYKVIYHIASFPQKTSLPKIWSAKFIFPSPIKALSFQKEIKIHVCVDYFLFL